MNLFGKTVGLTGSTGGLGREICFALAKMGANLVLVDRNLSKSEALASELKQKYQVEIKSVQCDMANFSSVTNAKKLLSDSKIDIFFLNAGIFNVPIPKNELGFNNVFQVNFLSQYFLVRKLIEEKKCGVKKVVAMASIAYKNSVLDEDDIDFSKGSSLKVYGNAKKFLMYSLLALAEKYPEVEVGLAHPGITLTKLTGHYPKIINWIVKGGMKLIFPSVKKASRSAVLAICKPCPPKHWFGPRVFDVYGKPKAKKLKIKQEEYDKIVALCEEMYSRLNKNQIIFQETVCV